MAKGDFLVAKANTIYGSVLGIQLIYAPVHFHIFPRQLIIVYVATGQGQSKPCHYHIIQR